MRTLSRSRSRSPDSGDEPEEGGLRVGKYHIAADATAIDARKWRLTLPAAAELAATVEALLPLTDLNLGCNLLSGSVVRGQQQQQQQRSRRRRASVMGPSGNAAAEDAGMLAVRLDTDLAMLELLCPALAGSNVVCLALPDCFLGPAAAALLAEMAAAMPRMERLNMSGNPFGDDGTALLLAALRDVFLVQLDMSGCDAGASAAASLAAMLERGDAPLRAALHLLSVMRNPIGAEGLNSLLEAVASSSVGSICGIAAGQTEADWA
jgi:hypothetical protein